MNSVTTEVATAFGVFAAHFSERGLSRIEFPGPRRGAGQAPVAKPSAAQRRWMRQTESALRSLLTGKKPRVMPPLDWFGATEFQRRVWRILRAIPAGQTMTYQQVAVRAGRPRAARAVGQSCGANPIPLLVPCHRVLAAGGSLGGFSSGLDWKEQLLAIELKRRNGSFIPIHGRGRDRAGRWAAAKG